MESKAPESRISCLNRLWTTVTGPTLYKIYPDKDYVGNHSELIGDVFIHVSKIVGHLFLFFWPMIGAYGLFKYLVYGELSQMVTLAVCYLLPFAAGFGLRTFGRSKNSDYLNFISDIYLCKRYWNIDREELLSKYDFSFSHWPAAFRLERSRLAKIRRKNNRETVLQKEHIPPNAAYSGTSFGISSLLKVLTNREKLMPFLTAKLELFLARLIFFPSSFRLAALLLSRSIADGRRKLIVDWNGQRAKLLCAEGLFVDSLLVDRRNSSNSDYGKYLVICCDSGSSFYETSPLVKWILKHGFSVLAYNRIGVGASSCSSATWDSRNEQLSLDVVINYAADNLRFRLSHILIVGSGAGNFASSWAACQYPEIGGLIVHHLMSGPLFSCINIEQLAKQLNIKTPSERAKSCLLQFTGPIAILGHGKEGLFQKGARSELHSHKATNLLIELLQNRFPVLFSNIAECDLALGKWFTCDTERGDLATRLGIDAKQSEETLNSYLDCHGARRDENISSGSLYPCKIGHGLSRSERINLILYLAAKHWYEVAEAGHEWDRLAIKHLPWCIGDLTSPALQPNNLKTFSS